MKGVFEAGMIGEIPPARRPRKIMHPHHLRPMTPTTRFDTVVIGSGPAGEGAAMQLAKSGRRAAVVETQTQVGGGCTHWGTIPSKALRHAIGQLADLNATSWLTDGRVFRAEYPAIRKQAEGVIARQVRMREGFYARNQVPILAGRARLTGAHTVEVQPPEPGAEPLHLEAAHIVVASGSRPWRPPDIAFDHPRVFDADTVLRMDFTPRSLTIYGAGVIGCEYASIFRGLGIKVNLVNTRDRLLEFLDDEIVDALTYHLRDQGIMVRHHETYAAVVADAEGVTMRLESGKEIRSDALLFTNGRSGNTDRLGLQALGVEVNKRGQIVVDEHFRCPAAPHIYAVGDVIGPPALASAAYDQGRYAAEHIAHGAVDHALTKMIPTGIYTAPEISSIGATERELTERKVPYEVGHTFFKDLARAQIAGRTAGMLKLLFHRETTALLGIHCFGAQAAEIIHIGQAIMAQPAPHNTVRYFAETTFNYPTMAEAYRVAALNGLNRLRRGE